MMMKVPVEPNMSFMRIYYTGPCLQREEEKEQRFIYTPYCGGLQGYTPDKPTDTGYLAGPAGFANRTSNNIV